MKALLHPLLLLTLWLWIAAAAATLIGIVLAVPARRAAAPRPQPDGTPTVREGPPPPTPAAAPSLLGLCATIAKTLGTLLVLAGLAILTTLVAGLWHDLGRPPLRTLGETRLWYALLIPALGLLLEVAWYHTGLWRHFSIPSPADCPEPDFHNRWWITRLIFGWLRSIAQRSPWVLPGVLEMFRSASLRIPMLGFGILFVSINLGHPEAIDRTLMPALQSPWFVPHVIVYMIAYAVLGLSAAGAFFFLLHSFFLTAVTGKEPTAVYVALPSFAIHIGLPFLTLGLLFGALWAKEAWGHYWSWDPKETWAFLSWAAYLGIIHLLRDRTFTPRWALALIVVAFLAVLGCWFLVNYLPAAAASVHTYTD